MSGFKIRGNSTKKVVFENFVGFDGIPSKKPCIFARGGTILRSDIVNHWLFLDENNRRIDMKENGEAFLRFLKSSDETAILIGAGFRW